MAPSPQPTAPPPAAGASHYQLLELPASATDRDLRRAFRLLSKRYHPDTTSLPAAEAREAFARLRQAYAVLADPDSRRAYDAALRRPLPPLPVVPPLPSGPAAAAKPIGVRRSLSGGEWFALVLLGLALALSLVLGVGLAWARGAALITHPSWLSEASSNPGAATTAVDAAATPEPSRFATADSSAAPPLPNRSAPAQPSAPLTSSATAPATAQDSRRVAPGTAASTITLPTLPPESPEQGGIGQAP
jgi:hypothetical protein